MSGRRESQIADRRVTEWFRREQALKEQKQEEERHYAPKRVITISRQYGCLGHVVAEGLARRLGSPWEVWDRQLIEQIALNARVRADMVAAVDERGQTWISEMVRRIFNMDALETLAYRRSLAEVLLAVAQQGCKIILGRGANFVLKDALNVRLRADEAYRVEQTMKGLGMDREEAQRKVRSVEAERIEFTRTVFGRDIDDPDAYDMILRTDSLGIDAVVDAVVTVYNRLSRAG